ncbi:MAG: TRAM domain-containing protein, partial [Actinomyces massiliensis]
MSRSGSRSHSSRSGPERLQTSGEAEEIILRVGSPAHGGHCVARLDDDPAGRVVFVRHALPGEVVRAVLTEKSAKIWRADAVEVLSASPDRVRSVWREAGPGGVGGGELGHVALSAQRTWKRWVLADCLRRIGGEEVAAAVAALPEAAGTGAVPVEAMPSEAAAEAGDDPRARRLAGTGTRTRIALTITDDGLAGMHGFRSGTVLPVT